MNENHLKDHANPDAVEHYLCGPPMMIRACVKLLAGLGMRDENIACDKF